MLHFNSQPHEEADLCCTGRRNQHGYFNSQPHEEADGFLFFFGFTTIIISTHSLTRRLTDSEVLTEIFS